MSKISGLMALVLMPGLGRARKRRRRAASYSVRRIKGQETAPLPLLYHKKQFPDRGSGRWCNVLVFFTALKHRSLGVIISPAGRSHFARWAGSYNSYQHL